LLGYKTPRWGVRKWLLQDASYEIGSLSMYIARIYRLAAGTTARRHRRSSCPTEARIGGAPGETRETTQGVGYQTSHCMHLGNYLCKRSSSHSALSNCLDGLGVIPGRRNQAILLPALQPPDRLHSIVSHPAPTIGWSGLAPLKTRAAQHSLLEVLGRSKPYGRGLSTGEYRTASLARWA
jgi:hypothetical protein